MNIDTMKEPLHKALTEIITYAGVPKKVIGIIVGLAMYSGLFFNTPWLLPLNFIMYIAAYRMTKDDAQFFEIAQSYMATSKHYHA